MSTTITPYDDGFEAFHNGTDLDANPFQEDTDDYYEWEAGWVTASDEEENEA